MTIVEFLLEREAERERTELSRRRSKPIKVGVPPQPRLRFFSDHAEIEAQGGWRTMSAEELASYHDDERYWEPCPEAFVLADVAVKRRIIEQCRSAWYDSDCTECGEAGYLADDVLRLLTQPYADHPDFDPSWGQQ